MESWMATGPTQGVWDGSKPGYSPLKARFTPEAAAATEDFLLDLALQQFAASLAGSLSSGGLCYCVGTLLFQKGPRQRPNPRALSYSQTQGLLSQGHLYANNKWSS